MGSERILLIEDDVRFGELQQDYLSQQGFSVQWKRHGRDVATDILHFAPALIVLDLGLPGISGLDICRNIRADYTGKILILTSSSDDFDHVACLELGADDFATKPINPRVLVARIRMLLRRGDDSESPGNLDNVDCLRFGGLVLKCATQEVYLDGNRIRLSNSEFNLFWIMATHADEVMERGALFTLLRGIEFDGVDRSIDTKIVALRKKLNDSSSASRRIVTVRNKGYLFSSIAWSDDFVDS